MMPLRIAAAGATDVGIERTTNEDALAVQVWPGPETGQPARRGLFVVADGVGGEAHGEVASQMTCRLLVAALQAHLSAGEPPALADEALVATIQDLSGRVYAETRADAELAGMSTTLTAALLTEAECIVMQVGDSRAYLLDERGQFWRCTQDDAIPTGVLSLAQRAELGAGAVGPTVLTQAIGAPDIQPTVTRIAVGTRGRYLLCTDGLHSVVTDHELQQALAQAINIQASADSLVQMANRRGGPDNITVILVDYVRGM